MSVYLRRPRTGFALPECSSAPPRPRSAPRARTEAVLLEEIRLSDLPGYFPST